MRYKNIIQFFIGFLIMSTLKSQVTNPRTLPQEWDIYGVGDPYIMKYKGKYWLYASTRDDLVGVKVWSSWDLATWNYEGLCTSEPITKGAYAPEVIYYNGVFYMYTSPGGNGHYILSSDNPTGPFVLRTSNLGLSIDGSVFLDDDGSLYFSYAGYPQIKARKMSDPLKIDGQEFNTNSSLNEWTEGSTIFKRNNVYYMTYTGNHVLSRGYRVAYGTATNPLGPYVTSNQGSILLNTEGSFYGLGHSGSVLGPDLDTWYIAYHNKYGDQGKGPIRALNIDPMAFNGTKMLVYGPCNWAQPAPQMPTFYDKFNRTDIGSNWININGGNWGIYNQEIMWQDQTGISKWFRKVSTQNTQENYSAEFNLKEIGRGGNDARFGAVFSYKDELNFGTANLSSYDNALETEYFVNGVSSGKISTSLPPSWDYQKWHLIRVEKKANIFKVYVDGMLKSTRTINGLGIGKIGVTTFNDHADFGYTAFSNSSDGNNIFDFYKPIPGKIEAVHFINGGEGVAYHDATQGNTGNVYRAEDVDITNCSEGGHNIGWNSTGEWYKYNVNVQSANNYHLGIRYATEMSNTKVRFWCDAKDISGIVTLPTTNGWTNWQTFIIKNLNLPVGYHTLKMETISGEFDFYTFEFTIGTNTQNVTDNFNSNYITDWNYSDGNWSINNGKALLNGYGKRVLGNIGWTDYNVEADVVCPAAGNAGLIFRVKNPANGLVNNDSKLGTDFYQGYYVGIQPAGIQLGKQNYNWQELNFKSQTFNAGQSYKIKVEVKKATIKVYVDNFNTPIINFFDTNPFLSGKAGLRGFNTVAYFDNFNVTTNETDFDCNNEPNGKASFDNCSICSGGNTGITPIVDKTKCVITDLENEENAQQLTIYPNPIKDELNIHKPSNDLFRVLDSNGKILIQSLVNNGRVNTSALATGLYTLQIVTQDETEYYRFFKE